ncbi:head-to-tail adaptor [Mycobacterium phage LilPharaoh]|uniref:Head-to-tail adaptor n=1 Tax=Mycobacterium phage Amelie TaxID=1913035 RepID=A0A1J0GQ01_9CAUD|nr:head-to-tail adaptor [Mycobacterium phage Enkosi]YP_009952528.1 head-to-tail adaptor [Mycobacterium phage Amelie]ATN90463.1 head-to-tail adaptor [Mycobacterium phage LilPharaoh]AVP42587.1 head-to-tail adaptor [Mycobacterium phage SgtBeansprout]AXC37116.1 head-to-tail adaptor [Mycobacterium phage Biglebops]QGJ93295.1 head-to-tail adaptor [Mycobacterium phage Mdavu]UQS94411.1 head-to-tail adaptor [Mycobacterium phage Nutello]UXE03172.1 head-to-tail adaptor [Mycobacterium phage Nikao]
MLATLDDVRAALRALRKPELAESLQEQDAADLLQQASDLVEGYLYPATVPTPTPGPITRVTAAMVAAALIKPSEILPETQTLQADGFGVTFAAGSNSPGPYLTQALKERLRPYRPRMASVSMGSERY